MSDSASSLVQDRIGGRPSWDAYFAGITRAVATRSTCSRRSVGAVLVKDKLILATGYNGAPAGLRHCNHADGADLISGHCARSTHAEQNAIVQAAKHGISIEGATLYCSNNPCLTCAKLLINAGITRIVYEDAYPDEPAFELLREAGIAVERFLG